MAKKTIQININEPCHEDWNKMTATQCGAFCKSCQKEVIDFTNKSEAQIVEILSQAKGKVCGRFTADKLNTPLSQYTPDPEWYSWKKWAVAAGVLFGTGYVSADVFDVNPIATIQDNNPLRTMGEPAISSSIDSAVLAAVRDSMYNGITPADTISNSIVVTDIVGQLTIELDSIRTVFPMQVDTPYILMGDIAFVEEDTLNAPPPPPTLGRISTSQRICKPKKGK